MQHVLKVPKVKLSIVINIFFPAAAVVVQSRLTFQSSTQQLGLARSENTHYVAARAESLCLICQSFQLFGDVTHFNGPMSLILHLAKVFLPPTPVQIKGSPCPSCHPHEAGSGSAAQAANTFSQCWCCCCPERKGGGMARADRSPGSWEGLTSPHLPGRGAKGCRAGDTGGAAPQCGAGRGFHTQPGPTAGTQDGWLWEKQLQLQGILCCTPGLNTAGNLCLAPNTELVSQCRAAQALAHRLHCCPPAPGQFTLQIISSTSREVSPGRMTVRAGWLLGRQNHEGVKYSCTQMSQSGLCWWTLLRATSFSL